MKASTADLQLLEDLFASPTANWRRFIDRYASTVIQVVQHARHCQKWTLTQKDADAVVVATFERLAENDLEVLRRFDNGGNFNTFLTVAARRIALQELQDRGAEQRIQTALRDDSAKRLQIPGS
ncbi:hypothetical protein AB1K70_17630 [Bremerella sp. JC770]|uniref:RNA polymerase sigma factor n=1 Tax=Bremerella sp. JC770 TaxID=3232137 RepID=UPI00345B0979